MQNSRELIDHLLRNKPAERVGVLDHPWWDTLEKWVDEGYPVNEEGKPVDAVDHFGFDLCGTGGWFDVMPLRGFSEVVEETDEWSIKRNGAGAAEERRLALDIRHLALESPYSAFAFRKVITSIEIRAVHI